MERRRGEQFSPDRPVADMTEPGKIPIRRRNSATGATCLEVLDRFGTFESLCWQLTELRSQNAELTQRGVATLESFHVDVPLSIEGKEFGNGCGLAGPVVMSRRDA